MIGLALILCLGAVITLIVILSKMSETTSRIRVLEERVSYILQELQGTGTTAEAKPPVVTDIHPEPSQTVAEISAPVPPVVSVNTPPPEPVPPPAPLFTPPPSAPSRTQEEWEALIGGKLLNRIGALALVIGIGFFLKYAFDNNWLSESVRVSLGAAAGFLLLLGAAGSRRRGLLIFAQGLVGAGIAVLYLSAYASFNYYHLVTQPVAFVLMAFVTIIAFTQAFLYDSIAVSLLGWIGGFLTPFMLSTGESNEIGLFAYIALLATGLLVVVMRKEKWAILEPLTVAATYFIYFLWYGQEYHRGDFAPTLFFAMVFWALFLVVEIVNNVRRVEVLKELRNAAAVFNAALFYLALFLLIDQDHHAWMGGTTLALGIIYFAAALVMRRRIPDSRGVFARLMCTAIVLFVLVPPIEFKQFTVIMYWSVEALLLAWSGRKWNLRFSTVSAFILFAIASWSLLLVEGALYDISPETHTLLFNMRSAAFAMLAVSMGIAGILFSRGPSAAQGRHEWDLRPAASSVFHFGWNLLLFILLTVETNDFFRHLMTGASGITMETLSFQRFMTQSLVWGTLAIVFALGAMQRKVAALAFSGIFVISLAMGMAALRGVAFAPIEQFNLFLNYRALVLLLVIAATFVMAKLLGRMKGLDWSQESADIIGVFGVILILILLTGETRDFFEKKLALSVPTGTDVAYPTDNLEDLKQLSLSGVWLVYSISLMGIGLWRRVRSLRVIAIVLFGVTILKIFIYDLSFLETLYRIFSFIGLGVVLLLVSYLYQHYKDVILQEPPKQEVEEAIPH
jgi:uncharacterized membrane protein